MVLAGIAGPVSNIKPLTPSTEILNQTAHHIPDAIIAATWTMTSEFPCGRGSLTGGGPHWWRKDRTRAGSPSKHHTTMNNIVFTTSHVSGFMVHFLDSRHSGYKLSGSGVARLCQENSTSPGRYRRHFLCRQVSLSQRHDDCRSPILSGPRLFPSSTNFLWQVHRYPNPPHQNSVGP